MGKNQSKCDAPKKKTKKPEPLRVVLIGKTGIGKSSTANTLLGQKEAFHVRAGLKSVTPECQWKETLKDAILLQVTDTPGLGDTSRKEEDILQEIGKSVAVALPGPHVVLMVLHGNARHTKEEFRVYNTLIQLFGDGIKAFMIIVFTHMDAYGSSLSEQTQNFLDQQLQNPEEDVSKIISDANNRVFCLNNEAQTEEFERQSEMLLDYVKTLWNENHRKHYACKISNVVSKLVEPLVLDRIQKGSSRDQAEVDTNVDIVENRVQRAFYQKLVKAVKILVLPAIRVVSIGLNIASLSGVCTLM